jgi:aromatic aminotransferase
MVQVRRDTLYICVPFWTVAALLLPSPHLVESLLSSSAKAFTTTHSFSQRPFLIPKGQRRQVQPLLLLLLSRDGKIKTNNWRLGGFPGCISVRQLNMKQSMLATSTEEQPTTMTIQTPPVSSRIVTTLDPCVVLMKELIHQYSHLWPISETGEGGIYSLAQGVVYWEPPETSKRAIIDAISSSDSFLHTYGPDEGLPSLRKAILEKLAVENNLQNHNVMITSGANQAYMNCVLTLLDHPSSKAVVFAPYYFNHVMALQMTLTNPSNQLLVGPTDTYNGQPNLNWLEQQFKIYNTETNNNDYSNSSNRIRMVTIVNPGNPSGTYLPRHYMQRVVDLCRTYVCWLVIDATYEYFVHTPTDEAKAEHYYYDGCFGDDPHVIHISSFSKSYALAGYRCGYVVLHNDAIIESDTTATHKVTSLFDQMMKVQDTIPICPSRISQIACLGAMESGREWVLQQIGTLQSSRAAILDALSPLLLGQNEDSKSAHNTDDSNNINNNTEASIMGGSGAMYIMGKLPSLVLVSKNEVKSNYIPTTSTTLNHDDATNNSRCSLMDDVEVATVLVRDFGVAVIPGSFCGFPGWIRVCYSNLPPSLCLVAATRLKKGLTFVVNQANSKRILPE